MSEDYGRTCLGVVPIRAGVFAIGIIQMAYEGTSVGMYIHQGMEERSLKFYVEFAMHCLNVLASTLLIIGLGTRTRQMFIPWLLITVLMPTMFLLNLFTTLLFMQFHLAADLIVHEALIALVVFYCCTVVYELYCIMELEEKGLIRDFTTVYGATNIVFENETRPQEDSPPSYNSVVEAQKQHQRE